VIVLAPLNAPGWLFDAGLVAVPAAVAVGVLRYRLLGVEVVIRRTLQFAVLTLLVVGIYTAAAAATSALVAGPTGSRVLPPRPWRWCCCRCETGCRPGWTGWSTAPVAIRSARSGGSARRYRRPRPTRCPLSSAA
jgi:hypothetical protein